MSRFCATCRFFSVGTTSAFPNADGMCRRHAPQGAVIGCHHNGYQVFPPMSEHHWCGEHEPIRLVQLGRRLTELARVKEQ